MRGINSALTSVAAVLGVAMTLSAQGTAPGREPPKAERANGTLCYLTDTSLAECGALRRSSIDSVMMKRAILGVQLSSTGSMRDTIGVFITRVTPKGPAENAGIIEGDRIVSINGVDLRVNAADAGDSYASDLPSRRLSREVKKMSPGSIATLRVSSGGRIRDVRVTAGKASDFQGSGFGYTIGGGPDGFTLRSFPRMSMDHFKMPMMPMMPMMRMEDMPGMRMEDMRVRVIGPERRVYIYRDSAETLRKSKK